MVTKQCCTAESSILRYRLSNNSDWQEIKLLKGTYCVEVINNVGGWYELAYATPPGAPFLCNLQYFVSALGDNDPTAVYTNSGSTAPTCPGNRGQTNTYRNGILYKRPDDIISISYEFRQPNCQLKVTNEKNQTVFTQTVDRVGVSVMCPIEYTYLCDSDCPKGFLKCESSNYPGYCCLPCSSTKAEIEGIKNIVKSVNKGSVSNG